jgi:polysaccharide biosynthesis transport protein
MGDLLNRARDEFDAIVIDTPPVLTVADARVLARLADAVVLVFRAGRTTRDVALTAVNMFEADGVPVLGTVLNDWNPRERGSRHAHGSYSYYYRPASNG